MVTLVPSYLISRVLSIFSTESTLVSNTLSKVVTVSNTLTKTALSTVWGAI